MATAGTVTNLSTLEEDHDDLDTGHTSLETRHDNHTIDLSCIDHHWHSRWRVYPQDVTTNVQLEAVAPANTFGDWTQIIPINTVPFDYDVIGLVIEEVSAATTYYIQLGHSETAAEPAANYETGERRVRLVTVPIARATELLDIKGQDIPANSSFWGRLKTASGAADTANISVVIARHTDVTTPIEVYTAFPW